MDDEADGTSAASEELLSRSGRWVNLVSGGALRVWQERTYAKRASRRVLEVYREVEACRPELTGVTRYKEVVARHTGLDDTGVRRILRGAESSFAAWPVERPLRFRDVVEYLVVTKCLADESGESGVHRRMREIIDAEIPGDY
jgi:hypothetical protein